MGQYIHHLEGKEYDFSKPYRLDAAKFIKMAPGAKEFPKAHSLTVLDQTVVRIYRDGSHSEVSHIVHKILDEQGKERYHRAKVSGNIWELRTWGVDGRTWEPIIPSQGSVVPPALVPGACLEEMYETNSSWNSHPFQFRWGPFYFKDFNFDEPVLYSRLVAIISNRYPVKILERNMKVKPKVIKKRDVTIYIWTVKNQKRTEIERFMPSAEELLPHIHIYTNRSLESHLWRLRDQYSAELRHSPQIFARTKKIIKGLKSDYAKAKAIYQFVNQHVSQGYGDGRSGSPLEVYLERSGDRGILFQAMLREAEIPFVIAMVQPPSNPVTFVEPEIKKELGRGMTMLIKVLPKGHPPVWVRANVRTLPFGKVPEDLQGGEAYIFTSRGFQLEKLARDTRETNANLFTLSLQIDDKGGMKGTMAMTFPGSRGYSFKERIKNWPAYRKKNACESLVNRYFPSARLVSYRFHNVKGGKKPLKIEMSFAMNNFLRPQGKEFVLPTGLPPLRFGAIFAGRSKRVHELIFPHSMSRIGMVEIDLGENWVLKNKPGNLMLREKLGTYIRIHTIEGSKVYLQRRVFLRPFRLKPADYPRLLHWCRQMDGQERVELTVVRKK